MLQEFLKHYTSGIDIVIMDLEKSKVVNSIGISYLIEIIEQINQNNGKLFFTNLDPAIEKTFKIMGLFQYAEKVFKQPFLNNVFLYYFSSNLYNARCIYRSLFI
jgi:anti-anti-sigma factor